VPKQDRLTFTAELHFSREGQLTGKDFYPSLIHSNERMTYTSVKQILVDKDRDERKKYAYLLESFEAMEELFSVLREIRIKRGSLDFDLPEPEILLDLQGRPESIGRAERTMAHMIIEEFMIAANEAVASHLESLKVPSIYRVHEKPDTAKIDELKPIFTSFGLNVKKSSTRIFHSILRQAKGTVEESLLNILLLRSLKQARYFTENIGHFGLASTCYTHFTSPIRRYPDLVVHRILKASLGKKSIPSKLAKYLKETLPDISVQSSNAERKADEAEREIVNAMRVWFMKDKVGDQYAGFVTNITSHGLKIQLKEFFIEGFLHVSSMADDYYRFDEKNYRLIGRRRKNSFAVGQNVTVRVERVDIEEREIRLVLA
jgi:ribonuclease R